MAEHGRFKGKVTGARITRTAAWWFVSIQVERADETFHPRTSAVGIDVGLNRLATLSTSEGFRKPGIPQNHAQKAASGRASGFIEENPGQKTVRKRVERRARLHYRVTCMRDDVLHKLTTRLANGSGLIGIEDLNRKRIAQEVASLLARSLMPLEGSS